MNTTTLTQLWTLTRGSNVIRRTTFDEPLTYGGNLFAVAPLQPSSFDEHGDLSPNQLEMAINLDGSGITEAALMGHTWDRARLTIQAIDWTNLVAAPVRTWRGFLANAEIVQGQLARAEFLSTIQLLGQPIGDLYSSTCRVVEYGDEQCGKDVTAETFTGEVIDITDNSSFRVDVTQAEANYFQFGPCKFTSGLNAGGDKLQIKTSAANGSDTDLVIVQEFPFAVQLGDEVEIIRGCDREPATCIGRNNILRIRCEPGIPGLDKLLRRFPE